MACSIIQVRLLSLLLHLSNSQWKKSTDDLVDDEGLDLLRDTVQDVRKAEREKADQIRKMLAEGEENDWTPPGSSGILQLFQYIMFLGGLVQSIDDAHWGRGGEGDTSCTPSKDLENFGHKNALKHEIRAP